MTTPLKSLAIALAGMAFLLSTTAHAQGQEHAGLRTFNAVAGGASDDLSIQFDVAQPFVSIDTPAYGSVLGSTATTVIGTVTDSVSFVDPNQPGHVPNTVTWKLIDGQGGAQMATGTVPVSGGHFVIPDLPLVIGNNVITAHVSDAAGWTNDIVTFFTVDPNAPAAALVGFQDGQAVLASREQFDLNFAAPTTIVSVNGVPDGRSFPAGLAAAALDEPLDFGPNAFHLVLQSGAEVSDFTFTLFRVESIGPIAFLAPSDRTLMNQTAIPVRVSAPLGTPFVTVNGVRATVGADLQTFTATVPLREGTNVLTAVAYPFGQRATIQVVRDTTPPRLIQVAPADGQILVDATLTVQGIVSEPATVHLEGLLGGFDVQTSPLLAPVQPFFAFTPFYIYTFEIPFFQLAVGDNPIAFTLTDRAGNTAEVPYTLVNVDGAVHILDLDENNQFDALEMTLRVEAFEQVAFDALYVGGRQLASFRARNLNTGVTSFDHVPLVPGTNEIRLVYHRYGSTKSESVSATAISTAKVDATLRGTATDAVTGQPLPGATVTIARGTETLVLTTSAAGTWSVDVPPGPFHLVIRHPGFIPGSIDDQAGVGETLQLDYAALRWDHGILPASLTGTAATSDHLEGTVTSQASGQALAGAQVRVTSSGASLTALSGPDGSYVVDGIPLGAFSVAVSKPGFFPIEYAIDDTEAVDVRLATALKTQPSDVSVVATVQNPTTGDPSAGVRATLIGTPLQVFSDAQGHFQLDHVPIGQRSLRLEKSGFTDSVVVFDANPRVDGGPTTLTLPYPQNAGQAKFIATSPGQVAYVRDRFSSHGIAGATIAAEGQTLTTDPNGAFVIPSLPSGQYSFVASASHYGSQTLRVVIAPDGSEPLAFDLLSKLHGAVVGTIRDGTTHVGIALATVKVAGASDQITQTASDGSFVLAGVTPGTYDLEVTHGEYLAGTIPAVSVASNANTVANDSLTHRPMVGGVTGLVLDADANTPIASALISQGAISTTSDAQGRYALSGLPSGMDTLAITAPGYPLTTRDVAITADADPVTPSIVRTDLHISHEGDPEPDHPVEIHIATGGRVSDSSGRLTLILPPLSINRDARVTVRLSSTPEVASGQPVPLDPSLHTPPLLAVGPEMEIVLEPLVAGAPVPRPVSPWILIQRYSGTAASAAGIAESSLLPLPWNGNEFTAFETIPYMHVVDPVDRLVGVVVNPTTTESGVPLFASLVGKNLPVYAASIEPQPTPNEFDLSVQLSAVTIPPAPTEPVPTALVKDLRTEPALTADPNTAPHPNAFPLLFIHGWDPDSIFTNFIPQANPFDDPVDERFSHIIPDIINGTAGIYRPIWVSYNTRAPAQATAWSVYYNLQGQLASNIRGIPVDPEDPNSGKFDAINIFGYSKGGLVERSLLCKPDIGGLGAVAMATPHHGAARRLIPFLDAPISAPPPGLSDVPIFFPPTPPATLRQVMDLFSPGTTELFDYPDTEDRFTLNPYLAGLNERECSVGQNRMTLIAGDDPTNHSIKLVIDLNELNAAYLAAMSQNAVVPPNFAQQLSQLDEPHQIAVLNPVFNLGAFLASNPSDSLVPLSSASGRDHSDVPLPAFQGVDKGQLKVTDPAVDPVHFNHFDAGTEKQLLGDLVAKIILPTFSDWFTTTQTAVPIDVRDPTEPGGHIITAPTVVEWYSPQKLFTGFVRVAYARTRSGVWHLVAGADQASGQLDQPEIDLSGTGQDATNSRAVTDRSLKTMNTPMKYRQPTQDSKGNVITSSEWDGAQLVITIPLPYHDPNSEDPESEDPLPTEDLPKLGFESFVQPGAPSPFIPPSD